MRSHVQSAVREWQEAHHALAKAVMSESQDIAVAWNRVSRARCRLMNVELSTPAKLEYMRLYMEKRREAKAQAQPPAPEPEGSPNG